MNKTISILGYGWLGKFVAAQFKKSNYTVNASTTTEKKLSEINSLGYVPFMIDLDQAFAINSSFLNAEIHLICIPPSKVKGNYAAVIQNYLLQIKHDRKVVFISSTSVYPQTSGEYHETSVVVEGKMLEAEKVISAHNSHYILRCSGLIGPERDPANFLAGKTGIGGALSTVNLVHGADVSNAIEKIVHTNHYGIYNLNLEAPSAKMDFYIASAKKSGKTPPEFDLSLPSFERKIVASKIIQLTEIDFYHTRLFYGRNS